MNVKLAENYGFCFGVKRAIKIAEENIGSSTYGPLIHNGKEINRLQEDFQVSLVEDISTFKEGDKAVIRTHGIPKDELALLHEKKIDVIDATCPYVTKPQQICEEMSNEGYDIVIFGDVNHPEIKGVMSYAKKGVTVVESVEELEGKFFYEKIAVVAQTTRKVDEFMKVCNHLMRSHKEVRVFNTICNATFDNQDAVKALANESDVMVVIGGKNSSNTKELHSISKDNCKDSYLVEGPDDLDSAWFLNKKDCGVSAGASTPDWIIKQVTAKIKELS
ncbi:4-hydroxy-3-methylbut-2-enyl diphosphate reductase [Sulfurimonas sp. MAG313]|nr:4-hydroxy-3-methylbut-2-enyl diphosphate reductase [Sulfurimonas sp. MAG313]MDF1881533.1 4-hydroxy-3-methylbut-2-enyl diphosphate reductase [Sulfurimonas sp. MAG313]